MVFGSLINNANNGRLYLGAPEAEAESTGSSRVSLIDVYRDWHDLFEKLSHEKFIIVGRKGSGKSAFARYAQAQSKSQPNLFVDFVQQDTANLEKLVQIGTKEGHELQKESIFKWLIYTHLIRLFANNEAAKQSSDFEQLRQFIRKNSGFVNITESEIQDITENKGLEVNIEPLKRFYRQKIKKDMLIKSQRAPFYKLLPNLEEVIISVLTSKIELENKNSYVMFFDDLDVGFDISDQSTVDSVVNLIRITKSINNNIFSANNINAKVVILLRDDVEKYVSDKYPDTAKIFASYSSHINWYQDYFHKGDDENELNIKKFIDLRISNAFHKASLPCSESNPWNSLVDSDDRYLHKTSFKYVLDHTLFRPRDLLLFFLPLEEGNLSLPLNRRSINSLIGKYTNQLVREFRGEISSFYNKSEITEIFRALEKMHNSTECSYHNAVTYIKESYKGEKDPEDILKDLFDRSVIGNKDSSSNFKFKHREPIDGSEIYSIDKDHDLVMQLSFKAYFNNRKSN
jgi:hypothetical protein